MAWTREGDERFLVAVNFTDQTLPLAAEGELVLSSDPDRTQASAPLELGPSEALLLRLSG